MPTRKHYIQLSQQEIETLETIIKTGMSPAKVILHANILLASNANEAGKMKTQAEVARMFGISNPTVATVRRNYAQAGLEAAIYRKKYDATNIPVKLDGELEAHIISVACSEVPEGYARWTLRMIADRTVELGYADSLSHTTVANALKKTNFSLT